MMVASCVLVVSNAEGKRITDWSFPEQLGDLGGRSVQESRVAMNEAGDAVVAWQVYDGAKWIVNATVYSYGTWGETVTLSSGPGGCGVPAVAIDGLGNALVMYSQFDGYQYSIYSVSYSSASWGAPMLIASQIDNQPTVQIDMNADGDAVAVWNSHYESLSIIEQIPYRLGSWQMAEASVISNLAYSAGDPQITVNGDGDALAAWVEEHGSTNVVVSANLDDGVWSSPQTLSFGNGHCANPMVGLSSDGRAVVVWQQVSGTSWIINATSGLYGMWEGVTTLSSPGTSGMNPQVAMNDEGDIGIIWTTEIGFTSIIHAMVRQSSGWVQEDLSSGTAYVGSPQLAINQEGMMMAIWYEESEFGAYIQARAYVNGVWGDEQNVEAAYDLYSPRVAADGYGRAMATWCADDNEGLYQVYASIYAPAPRVSITSPHSGSVNNTASVTVEWTGTNVDHYNMSVNGAEQLNLGTDTSATLSALADGEYEINITAFAASGLSSYDLVNFVVDTAAPAVVITNPAIGAWYNSSTMNVTWTVSDAGSGVANVSVSMDGGAWTDVANNYNEFTGLADGQHNVSVRSYDNAGNLAVVIIQIIVDNEAPTAAISPSGSDVSRNAAITVSFSEAMNETSVMITVDGLTGIEGTVTWDGNVATFTPSSALAYDTVYTVNVTGKDLAGNSMAEIPSGFTTLKDQGTLSGTIRDADGKAVANATVTLSNGMNTTTDVAGHFEFTGVPSGTYTMNVTKDGFKAISQTVNVVAGQSTALESLSMASNASSSDGGNGWILGIVGVVIVAMLAIGFIVYRYKKK